jgi:hypothetical protein
MNSSTSLQTLAGEVRLAAGRLLHEERTLNIEMYPSYRAGIQGPTFSKREG